MRNEKQQKVLDKIIYNSGQTTPLGTKPNDECYTSMQDIVNELAHYGCDGKFKGKNIICPCDWDILEDEEVYSLRVDFDEDMHAHTNAVKTVSYESLESISKKLKSIKVDEKKIYDFLNNRTKCNFLRTLIQNADAWGVKSVSVSGYNPATGQGKKFQNVDYSQYDICITNPPFSLYDEFMKTLIKAKIDFIVLAPFLNRANPCVGLPLFLRQCYLGFGRHLSLNFYNSTSKNEYKTKNVACDWLTTFNDAQKKIDRTRLQNGIKYENYKDDYAIMENMTMKDGTHPLKMPFRTIPDDYYGWVFCPINILDELSNEEFKWYGTNFQAYYNNDLSKSPFNHKMKDELLAYGKDIQKQLFELPQKDRRKLVKEMGLTQCIHGVVLKRKEVRK